MNRSAEQAGQLTYDRQPEAASAEASRMRIVSLGECIEDPILILT